MASAVFHHYLSLSRVASTRVVRRCRALPCVDGHGPGLWAGQDHSHRCLGTLASQPGAACARVQDRPRLSRSDGPRVRQRRAGTAARPVDGGRGALCGVAPQRGRAGRRDTGRRRDGPARRHAVERRSGPAIRSAAADGDRCVVHGADLRRRGTRAGHLPSRPAPGRCAGQQGRQYKPCADAAGEPARRHDLVRRTAARRALRVAVPSPGAGAGCGSERSRRTHRGRCPGLGRRRAAVHAARCGLRGTAAVHFPPRHWPIDLGRAAWPADRHHRRRCAGRCLFVHLPCQPRHAACAGRATVFLLAAGQRAGAGHRPRAVPARWLPGTAPAGADGQHCHARIHPCPPCSRTPPGGRVRWHARVAGVAQRQSRA